MAVQPFDVVGIGNAIVDIIARAEDSFLEAQGMAKGGMMLIDEARAEALYAAMGPAIEASGGSVGNTIAGLASLGARAAFIGKTRDDLLGKAFHHDITAIGVHFDPAQGDAAGLGTGRCLINVTPDGQRTMATYLGAANALGPDDVTPEIVQAAQIVYLEGYLFDPPAARQAFAKAAALARAARRRIALTLSDGFVVERHRDDLLAFIASEVDIVFANAAEVAALFRTSNFDDAVKRLSDLVDLAAVTRGEQGSVLVSKSERAVVAAAPVAKVVDTTGAGDQYAAGVLFGLARGRDLAICGRLGSLAAAEVIGHFGPRPQTSLKALAEEAGLI